MGEPGPPCRYSSIGLRASFPRTWIHCLMPPISTALRSSMPPGMTCCALATASRAAERFGSAELGDAASNDIVRSGNKRLHLVFIRLLKRTWGLVRLVYDVG